MLPREAVGRLLGRAAGTQGVILAGLLGGLLPGGPFAVYPIVHSIGQPGATLAAVIALIIGYGAIGVGRIPYGLVFFDLRIVAIRLLVGVGGVVFAAVIVAVLI